jgi:hypothetical protein
VICDLPTVTVFRKSLRSKSQAAGCQRSLWIKLRKVRIACPPVIVQAMPDYFKRWGTSVLQVASITPLAMGRPSRRYSKRTG